MFNIHAFTVLHLLEAYGITDMWFCLQTKSVVVLLIPAVVFKGLIMYVFAVVIAGRLKQPYLRTTVVYITIDFHVFECLHTSLHSETDVFRRRCRQPSAVTVNYIFIQMSYSLTVEDHAEESDAGYATLG